MLDGWGFAPLLGLSPRAPLFGTEWSLITLKV